MPADGQTFQLRATANLAIGNDSWAITDFVPNRVAGAAIAAVAAVAAVAAIVDHCSPNTARVEGSENWYFSLNQANTLFTARVSDEVSLAPMPLLRAPRWSTLRLLGDERKLSALRSSLVAEISNGKVHGSVTPVRDGQFDMFLVSKRPIVDSAERTLRKIADRRGTTVNPVSKVAFRTAAGFLA